MDYSVMFGSATRHPPGPPLGKPLRLFAFPTFPNVRAERRVCHFSSSSMRILARGIESGGGGRRPLQIESVTKRFRIGGLRRGFKDEELAGGWQGARSLMRQAPWLLRKCCRAVPAGSRREPESLRAASNPVAEVAGHCR